MSNTMAENKGKSFTINFVLFSEIVVTYTMIYGHDIFRVSRKSALGTNGLMYLSIFFEYNFV